MLSRMILKTTAAAAALTFGAGMAIADYSLTILHTNDFHSRFEPVSKYDSGCSEEKNLEGKCFGGTARLITAVAAARARSNNSILVSGGDQFQGSLFYTYYKGKVAAEMMNKLGYDAMTVGNHEFDDGPEVLRGFMDALDFPVLMSNADYSGEAMLAGKLVKSVVIELGPMRVSLRPEYRFAYPRKKNAASHLLSSMELGIFVAESPDARTPQRVHDGSGTTTSGRESPRQTGLVPLGSLSQ